MNLKIQVSNTEVLKNLFKGRFDKYVTCNNKPTKALVRLICDGDDLLRNKVRKAVEILP